MAALQDHVSPQAYHQLTDRQTLEDRTKEFTAKTDAQQHEIEKLKVLLMNSGLQTPGPPPIKPIPPQIRAIRHVSSSRRGSVSRSKGTVRPWLWGLGYLASGGYLAYSIVAACDHPWDSNAPGYSSYWNIPWVVGGPIAAIVLVILLVGMVSGPSVRKTGNPRALKAARKRAMAEPDPPPEEEPEFEPTKNFVQDHYEGLFPPDVFEPYSTCPKCGVEALHWMRTPYEDEGTGENTRTSPYWRENIHHPKQLSTFGVIRTCRNENCGVSWGQSTPIDKQMSTEAVLVPRVDTNDQVVPVDITAVPEEVIQDRADVLADIQNERLADYLKTEHEEESGWSVLGNVVKREGSSVPAPVNERIDPVEQWADAFMDGVAPERTYEEVQALNATTFNPSDIAGSVANAIGNMIRETPSNPGQTPSGPTPNTPTVRAGGELSQADAQPKLGKDKVADYRAKGGKMHIVGPGGLVMAAKDPETGQWGVPNKRTTMLRSERDTGPALPTSHTKAIDAEIIDVEEVPLPEDNDG